MGLLNYKYFVLFLAYTFLGCLARCATGGQCVRRCDVAHGVDAIALM